MNQLLSLKYRGDAPLTNDFDKFQGLANQLVSMNIKIEEEVQELILLSLLPSLRQTFRISFCNSTGEGSMSINSVKGAILNEEAK